MVAFLFMVMIGMFFFLIPDRFIETDLCFSSIYHCFFWVYGIYEKSLLLPFSVYHFVEVFHVGVRRIRGGPKKKTEI